MSNDRKPLIGVLLVGAGVFYTVVACITVALWVLV